MRAAVAAPTLRCVIATGVLDVGGAEEFAGSLSRQLPRARARHHRGLRRRPAARSGGRGRTASPDAHQRGCTDGAAHAGQRPGMARTSSGPTSSAPTTRRTSCSTRPRSWAFRGWRPLHGMHMFFHPDSWEPERQRARRISAQIAVSDLVRRQYLVRNPDYPRDRIVTVPNGLDQPPRGRRRPGQGSRGARTDRRVPVRLAGPVLPCRRTRTAWSPPSPRWPRHGQTPISSWPVAPPTTCSTSNRPASWRRRCQRRPDPSARALCQSDRAARGRGRLRSGLVLRGLVAGLDGGADGRSAGGAQRRRRRAGAARRRPVGGATWSATRAPTPSWSTGG